MREKWASLEESTQLGKLGSHSQALLFPHGRNHGPSKSSLNPKLCLPWGRSDFGKIKLFLLPTPMHPNSKLIFFSPVACWIFSSGNLDFSKVSLIRGWLPESMFLWGFQTGWEGLELVCGSHQCPQLEPRSLCLYYLMHGWVRFLLCVLAQDCGAGLPAPTKSLLFNKFKWIFVVGGGGGETACWTLSQLPYNLCLNEAYLIHIFSIKPITPFLHLGTLLTPWDLKRIPTPPTPTPRLPTF